MTNLVVAVRNEALTDEEVAAAVAQASTAYLLSLVRANAQLRDDTERDVYGRDTEFTRAHTDENGVLLYKNPVLYALAKKAAAEGRSTFHAKTIKYKTIPCEPEPYYDVRLRLTPTIEEGISGDRETLLLESKDEIAAVIAAARGMGWREGEDYFPFEYSVGFRPMSSEELHTLTKKFLYLELNRRLNGGFLISWSEAQE